MSDAPQQKGIHHFPGHMKKALESLMGFVKAADIVLEVRDARIPVSSRNPLLDIGLLSQKPRLIVLSKMDLADKEWTKRWIEHYRKDGLDSLSADLKGNALMIPLKKALAPLAVKKREKEAKSGMKPQPIRLLVIGIPNVGKSTLINNLAGKKAAKAANRPGVTRSEQWIKLDEGLILLDTPGILPMNYEDRESAKHLAMAGSIREEILPVTELAHDLLFLLKEEYGAGIGKRYGLEEGPLDESLFVRIAACRGYLSKGGEPDLAKAERMFLKDFQNGFFGPITLERP